MPIIKPLVSRAGRIVVWRRTQIDAFSEYFRDFTREGRVSSKSSLTRLSPFISPDGLICVSSRLVNGPFPYGTKHPVILPPKSRITNIVIWKAHRDTSHSSVDCTYLEIRRQFWIP